VRKLSLPPSFNHPPTDVKEEATQLVFIGVIPNEDIFSFFFDYFYYFLMILLERMNITDIELGCFYKLDL